MKKLLLCVILFSINAPVMAQDMHITQQEKVNVAKANFTKFGSQYFTSILLSGAIGATTGGLVKYVEKQLNIEASPIALFLLLLSWTLESEFRNDVIAMVQKDLDGYAIGHKKSLMYKSAWIASWLAYLHV